MANDNEKTDKYIEAIWEKERRLKQYAIELKAFCDDVQNGYCKDCQFGKKNPEGCYPEYGCKISDYPNEWEV
jgi:hypothetical protein